MSVDNMDKKEFEFIREEIIAKKPKKFRIFILRVFGMIALGILFGLIAAITFCLAEPRLSKGLTKEEVKKPITFPSNTPEPEVKEDEETAKDDEEQIDEVEDPDIKDEIPNTVINNTVTTSLEDYMKISDEIRTVAYRVNKSLITVSSSLKGKDIFGNPTLTKVETSGLFIGQNETELFILVSYDRVKNASTIKLKLSESVLIDAELLTYDSEINLAMLTTKIDDIPKLFLANNIVIATLGESYTLSVGSPVIALGSPNGYPGSMDIGIITNRNSSIAITDYKLDLFNTNINNNSNGDGVIINMKGEVIGIITRNLREGLNQNLNTSIGISKIKYIIAKMANNEPRTYFGVYAEDMTDTAKSDYRVEYGIYVNDVIRNSPAANAGIRVGDIITEIDDKNVININSFNNMISAASIGDEMRVKVKRFTGVGAQDLQVKLILQKKNQ